MLKKTIVVLVFSPFLLLGAVAAWVYVGFVAGFQMVSDGVSKAL